jgi:uncharacterized circularly permuted ATP-grasp superfamily protein
LTAGIVQRAELLELVLSDIYGEGRLIAEGRYPRRRLPAAPNICARFAVSSRQAAAISIFTPRTSAAGPTGAGGCSATAPRRRPARATRWKTGWCCRAPFTSLYKSMNVERVAPFFEAFRDSLRASADRDEPRIGLLTPGTFSETYFEHATLARYLGFLLVEGDDLAVSGDRVHIRTVAGLKRLDVLLRRVDSNSLDPLELDAHSQLGVPGLIDVIRKNGVVVANMPGSA